MILTILFNPFKVFSLVIHDRVNVKENYESVYFAHVI